MRWSLFVGLFPLVVSAAGCREPPRASSDDAAPLPRATSFAYSQLTRVAAASTVCMVNDQWMGKEQIPVVVEGRTYYGCCAGCKAKLETSASARTGTDPVTGHAVDKATAVIAKNASGKVFYFESEDTLARHGR